MENYCGFNKTLSRTLLNVLDPSASLRMTKRIKIIKKRFILSGASKASEVVRIYSNLNMQFIAEKQNTMSDIIPILIT